MHGMGRHFYPFSFKLSRQTNLKHIIELTNVHSSVPTNYVDNMPAYKFPRVYL